MIRQLIRINLELDGFEVMTAADGAACLEAVHDFRPDVITLDLAMPRLDGSRTVDRLRLDPRTVWIPLVVVSASAGGALAVPVGVDAVVAKPFEPSDLVGLVRTLCAEGRPASRTLAP